MYTASVTTTTLNNQQAFDTLNQCSVYCSPLIVELPHSMFFLGEKFLVCSINTKIHKCHIALTKSQSQHSRTPQNDMASCFCAAIGNCELVCAGSRHYTIQQFCISHQCSVSEYWKSFKDSW